MTAAALQLPGIDLAGAAARLRGVLAPTPLLQGSGVDGRRLYLKLEAAQPTGSFKVRGAYNALAWHAAMSGAPEVVAHSSGNHGAAVAWAARRLGMRATIVAPANAAPRKLERVLDEAGRLVLVGSSSDERAERARTIANSERIPLVASSDDPLVVAGQATLAFELAEQLRALTEPGEAPCVLAPVGGGGLASGVALAAAQVLPDATVVGVEPALAADAHDSLAQDRLVSWPAHLVQRTSADGLRLQSLGRLPFLIMRRLLDRIVLVPEEEIAEAVAYAAAEYGLDLEPSGAVSLAAALFRSDELPAKGVVVCILSGGNVERERPTISAPAIDRKVRQ